VSWLTRSKKLAISRNSNYLVEVNLTSILQANSGEVFYQNAGTAEEKINQSWFNVQ